MSRRPVLRRRVSKGMLALAWSTVKGRKGGFDRSAVRLTRTAAVVARLCLATLVSASATAK